MLKITKSNARPGRSVSEEPPLVTLRTSDKLIRVQIDSSKSFINTIYSSMKLTGSISVSMVTY